MPTRRDLANAVRALSMDAVQRANSGHPGMPMGMADIAEVLWNDYLTHNPSNPAWPNRDRFVVSNGHGSMLLYSLIHLSGYDLPIEELQRFRQLGSKTPGHPEHGLTPGVETTTGPLGQGVANAVGMAIAERTLAAQFNRLDHQIIDHHTYVFLGDGCLMEGISHEACSFAGTERLGKLIAFYDDNGISIDGEVKGWFTDDTPKRFDAYGWHVVPAVDGHDPEAIKSAIEAARAAGDRPSLICCKTVIGWGSPNKAGKETCHGAALGEQEVALTREQIGWPHPPFAIPKDIRAGWDARARGAAAETAWSARFDAYRTAHPQLAAELERRLAGRLPNDWSQRVADFVRDSDAKAAKVASRKASQLALEGYGPVLPELLGGSADLTGSNLTNWSGSRVNSPDTPDGNYFSFGVREFGMSAILNGVALHGGFIPYSGTFLVFSEYARNALRMAALMNLGNVFVYSHDSIGLGEDGPTHQAVEQAATLRMIPRMQVWRPCDTVETALTWQTAIERRDAPTCLLLSRQGLPHQARDAAQIEAVARGGYVLVDCEGDPEAIVIASGSEIGIAVEGAAAQSAQGRRVRVVSMPCCEAFDAQDASYRESVLPSTVSARLSVEAGITAGWAKYVGPAGRSLGVDTFGESAPGPEVYAHFGLTAEHVAELIGELLAG